jgi:hypothetical protein
MNLGRRQMKRAWANPKKGDANEPCEFHTYELKFNNLTMIFTYEKKMEMLTTVGP